MKIKKKSISASKKIYADDMQDFGFADTIDDISDSVEDIQDTIDDMDEDQVDIDVDNNITNHYIAECQLCKNVFVSALVESDQEVSSITGICPVCDKEGEQLIKWIIKDKNYK